MKNLLLNNSSKEEFLFQIFELKGDIKVGDKFTKQVAKNKGVECEVVDIVKRVSIITGEIHGVEYYAKSNSSSTGRLFEVSRTTILKGR